MIYPIASFGHSQSNTNLSRSISLSIIDENGNDISISSTIDHPYRFLISRDPNSILPSMTLQNVTSYHFIRHNLLFNLHYINIGQSNELRKSVHIEMKSFNDILGYLMIYRFDHSPQLNSTVNFIDGWTLFCPSSKFDSPFFKEIFFDIL